MNRTVTSRQKDDPNFSRPYMVLEDGELWEVEDPDGEDGKILEGALSVRSCARDLMKYYISYMKPVQSDISGIMNTHHEPSADAAKMVEPHIELSTAGSDLDGAYSLGWIRVSLPCTLGANGRNHGFLGRMPIVGKGMSGRTPYWYHQGSANSFLSSVHLLPATQSDVAVLTDSMAQNDVADWLEEIYVEEILDSSQRNDYVALAKNSASAALALWPSMRDQIGNFRSEISGGGDQLFLRFQRQKRIVYDLTHDHFDTFSWLLTHDQNVKVGRFPITRASFYLIRFEASETDSTGFNCLIWVHHDKVLEGEKLFKKAGESSEDIEAIRVQPVQSVKAPEMLKKRNQYITIWKPLKGPLYDWPLALCDGHSVDLETDLQPQDIVDNDEVLENVHVYHRPNHRWFYLSGQQTTEALVFRQADTHDSKYGTPHCAIANPTAPEGSIPRESIEVVAFICDEN